LLKIDRFIQTGLRDTQKSTARQERDTDQQTTNISKLILCILDRASLCCASACHTDTTPSSHTETPTHIETRTHNQCGDTIEKSRAPDDGHINVRNMLSIEEVK